MGRRHFGVRVRPCPQILRPRPQESVDKRPHPHMSVNVVRGARMLNIQVQISGEGPHSEMEDKQKSRFQ